MNKSLCAVLAAFACVWASASSAATLIIDGDGFLTGATGVLLNGRSYTVTLARDNCETAYGTCDVSAFDFTTLADAQAAAQAVIDQVDNPFEALYRHPVGGTGVQGGNMRLIFGCGSPVSCSTGIAYATEPGGILRVNMGVATNYTGTANDSVGATTLRAGGAMGPPGKHNYARFTLESSAAPEPGTWALLVSGFGLAGAAVRSHRRRAAAA